MAESEFAKTHLREYLGSLLVSPISEGFWSIYDSSRKLCEQNNQMGEVIRTFQNMLTRIPDWTDSTLSSEVDRITKVTKCNYLDDLIMGVFISYMKSFASLHYHGNSSEIKIEFDRPSLSKFIHELYKHSARKLWQVAYLFKTVGVTTEQQARNRREIETMIGAAMNEVIDSFIPWKDISKAYFQSRSESEPVSESAPVVETQPVPAPALVDEPSKSVQFDQEEEEEEEEDSEDERPPAISLGEDIVLDDSEFDGDSVNMESLETVSLNL